MKRCLATIIDKDSIFDFVIMIYSLLCSNSGIKSKFDLVVFVTDECIKEYKGIIDILWEDWKLMSIPSEFEKVIEYEGPRDWCNADNKYKAHYRYAIFTLEQYDYVVYLDNDLIINNKICELLDSKYEGIHVVKKVPNRVSRIYTIKKGGEKIFNAGVMGISKKFLNKKTAKDLLELQKQRKSTGNQPVLNEYFESEVHYLDEAYNMCIENILSDEDLQSKILHFVGSRKPSTVIKFVSHVVCKVDLLHFILNKDYDNHVDLYIGTEYWTSAVTDGFGDYQIKMIGHYKCLEILKHYLNYYNGLRQHLNKYV